jgi:hypothetical protein
MLAGRTQSPGKVGLSLSNRPADGFGQVGIGVEDVFHRRVTNLKDLGFFNCHGHLRLGLR